MGSWRFAKKMYVMELEKCFFKITGLGYGESGGETRPRVGMWYDVISMGR